MPGCGSCGWWLGGGGSTETRAMKSWQEIREKKFPVPAGLSLSLIDMKFLPDRGR